MNKDPCVGLEKLKIRLAAIIAVLLVALVAGCTALTIINIEFDTNNNKAEISAEMCLIEPEK